MNKIRLFGAALSYYFATVFEFSGYQTIILTISVFVFLSFFERCYFYYPSANKENVNHYYSNILPEVAKFLSNKSSLVLKPKKILMPLPDTDFDPTECALAWKILKEEYKCEIVFTTENGAIPKCDPITLRGEGLNFITRIIFNVIGVQVRQQVVLNSYQEMENDINFKSPKAWNQGDVKMNEFDGIWITGGHAQGMRQLLSCKYLQRQLAEYWELQRPVAAVCHGVLMVARTRNFKDTSKSVLSGRKTTSLVNYQELIAYNLTSWSHGRLFRTFDDTTEDEILKLMYGCLSIEEARARNSKQKLYDEGPFLVEKEFGTKQIGRRGYIVEDGHYLSGRWPGDVEILAHRFGQKLQS